MNNNDTLIELLSEATRKQTTDWWIRELDQLGIPGGPVLNHEQLFNHPQILHRRMVETVEHPKAGPMKTLGIPYKLSDTPGSVRSASPLLGQHATEIITELRRIESKPFRFGRLTELVEPVRRSLLPRAVNRS